MGCFDVLIKLVCGRTVVWLVGFCVGVLAMMVWVLFLFGLTLGLPGLLVLSSVLDFLISICRFGVLDSPVFGFLSLLFCGFNLGCLCFALLVCSEIFGFELPLFCGFVNCFVDA